MVKNFRDIFIRFDATHERGRHTDRQTDGQTPHDSIGRAYASHRAGKTSSASHVIHLWFLCVYFDPKYSTGKSSA